MTDNVLRTHELTRKALFQRLTAIDAADWVRPTPCSEWDTRQLVNHVVGVQFRIGRLLRGGTKEDYIATREDDWLGTEHLQAWSRAVLEFDISVAGLTILDVSVDYRVPLLARDAIRLTAADTAVHCWDISRAIGFDDELPDELASFALESFQTFLNSPPLAALFASPTGTLPGDATTQQRLLHLAGR